jgi:hypothetical protein
MKIFIPSANVSFEISEKQAENGTKVFECTVDPVQPVKSLTGRQKARFKRKMKAYDRYVDNCLKKGIDVDESHEPVQQTPAKMTEGKMRKAHNTVKTFVKGADFKRQFREAANFPKAEWLYKSEVIDGVITITMTEIVKEVSFGKDGKKAAMRAKQQRRAEYTKNVLEYKRLSKEFSTCKDAKKKAELNARMCELWDLFTASNRTTSKRKKKKQQEQSAKPTA